MVTINDIAEKLHISNATVSRALRSSGYVRAELKEKIFRTAEELGYAPNPLAVGLRTRRSHGISIVLPSMNNPVSVELLENLEKLADRNGYHVMISTTDGNIETERKYVQLLDAGLVDGTVLVPGPRRSPEEEYLQHIRKRNIALFNRDLAGLSLDVVKSDAVQAGRLAMEHLACREYRRICRRWKRLWPRRGWRAARWARMRRESVWRKNGCCGRGERHPPQEKLPQTSFYPGSPGRMACWYWTTF